MPAKKTMLDKAIDASLELAADQPWSNITLHEIATACGVKLADFYGEVDKELIIDGVDQRLDLAAAAEAVDPEDSPRTRLFDVVMLRIEAMEAYRDAMLSIRDSWRNNPGRRVRALRRRTKSAKWLLSCAQFDDANIGGRTAIVTGILTRAENAWEKDIHGDFSRTMSQLDRDLRDIETWARRIKSFGSSRDISREGQAQPQADTPSS